MIRCLTVALLVCFAATSADTLESVEKTLIKKYASYQSLSATISMKMQMGPGVSGTGKGKMEYLKHDGHEKMRSELTMTMDFGAQKMVTTALNIDDGISAYTISEMMGQKRVIRTDRSKMTGRAGGTVFFADLRKKNSLKLLPEAKVDGVSCFAIEATPINPHPNLPSRVVFHFDKSKSILVKMEGFNASGETTVSMTLTDVKLNPKLDPARFTYTPEPGVNVTEMRQP